MAKIVTFIYGVFGVAAVVLTMAAGRYVSKGTYADGHYIVISAALVGGLAFYAIRGIVSGSRR